MKSIAIIQARMGSTRLPGKVMMKLAGVPVIKQVFSRVSMIEGLSGVLVATSTLNKDDILAEYCAGENIPLFRGSEDNVLDRYVQASRQADADVVMRITADCPFLDPRHSAKVLDLMLANPDCDYADNVTPVTYPRGLDTQVVRRTTLERLWKQCDEPEDREHVLTYIRNHPEAFTTMAVNSPVDYSTHRWTLDLPEDFEMLSRVAVELKERRLFGYLQEILRILDELPDIREINTHSSREE
jgi:spore coat polysaccharide biosynthesis protein SpsF (cytidylyltransferase family)